MEPKLYSFGHSGSCMPADGNYTSYSTFSLGIFQWIPSKNGKPKKSKAFIRVKGWSSKPGPVLRRAQMIVEELNNTYKELHPDLDDPTPRTRNIFVDY